MGEAGDVAVGGVALLAAGEGDDAVLGQVLAHLRAAGELLEEQRVAPGGVDRHLGGELVRVALEAHLVVAAAGGAVDERVDAAPLHRLDDLARRDRAADAGGVPVAAVVHRLALDRLEADVGHGLADVDDRRLHAAGLHLLLDVVDVLLVGLAEVRGEAEHVGAGLAQAHGDGFRVESAGDADADLPALHVLSASAPPPPRPSAPARPAARGRRRTTFRPDRVHSTPENPP